MLSILVGHFGVWVYASWGIEGWEYRNHCYRSALLTFDVSTVGHRVSPLMSYFQNYAYHTYLPYESTIPQVYLSGSDKLSPHWNSLNIIHMKLAWNRNLSLRLKRVMRFNYVYQRGYILNRGRPRNSLPSLV